MKECRKCKTSKPLSEYGRNGRFADGIERRCKTCIKEMRLAAYDRNPELYRASKNRRRKVRKEPGGADHPVERRRRHLKDAYGITLEEEAAMLAKQDGQCPICGDPATVVDHCHATMRVRGLLCQRCNRGLGHFMDSPLMLVKALEYLTDSATEYLTLCVPLDDEVVPGLC